MSGNSNSAKPSEANTVSVKFNVDTILRFDESSQVHRATELSFQDFVSKDPKNEISLATVVDEHQGLNTYKIEEMLSGDNMVKAGQTVKMLKSEAEKYCSAFVKKNGHMEAWLPKTDANDPRLFTKIPVAEIVKGA